jgi:hypothetical protein
MANQRVYFACRRVGIGSMNNGDLTDASAPFTTVYGLQNMNATTTFNLEQVYQLGQLELYQNIEGVPNIEVTSEKVLDGTTPVYVLATARAYDGTPISTVDGGLANRGTATCKVGALIYADSVSRAEGASVVATMILTKAQVSNVAYRIPLEGHATESCTLVADNKWWTGTPPASLTGAIPMANQSPSGVGGVQRRNNIVFHSGTSQAYSTTRLPVAIAGIDSSGHNIYSTAADTFAAHIASINVSSDLKREDIFELGRLGRYTRFINFPIEVTCEITVTATSGDHINAFADTSVNSCSTNNNLTDELIYIRMCESLTLDLGTKNKLASVATNGGDTGGGKQEITYTYKNFNALGVYHSADPVTGLRPGIYFAGW